MAGPGDPHDPDDHDDLIGFASPASLHGRTRVVESPMAAAEPADEPMRAEMREPAGPHEGQSGTVEPPAASLADTTALAPAQPDFAAVVPPVVAPPVAEQTPPRAAAAPLGGGAASAEPTPPTHASTFAASSEFSAYRRRRDTPAPIPGGGMGLYAVYALILFAVPTLGVAAGIGLFAVTARGGPDDDLSQTHFVYQQRTLWAAAVAAVAGVILLAAPFALGVPILFALAIWLVLRGASGVWALKAGRPIANPRGWWL